LKTHFLDGKRNRRIDRIVHTLVVDLVPYYQNRHERQTVGLEGPDLAGARRRQLLADARGTPSHSIQQFDSTHFHVASESQPGSYYEVDLNRPNCTCPDFPRSQFCKHLAAINIHFPHLCTKEKSLPLSEDVSDQSQHVPSSSSSSQDCLEMLVKDVKALSLQLDDKIAELTEESVPTVMEIVRTVKYSLTTAIASTQNLRALPDKETVAPNQKSWTETAKRMGVKRGPRKRLPEERGLTDRSIGASKGKRACIHTDPYGGGERSGKRAKPDALSATANARARAPTPSSGALPSNALPSAPSSVLPTPNAPPPFNMSCPATALPSPNTIPPLNVPHSAALTPASDPAWGAQALPPVPGHPHAAAFALPPHAPPPGEPALIPAANFHRVIK
jgi:hypothetical protein